MVGGLVLQAGPLRVTPQGSRRLAYGLHQATVTGIDGQVYTGGGLSEHEALHNAELKAAVSCEGCGRPVKPAEAQVSIRALGAVRCYRCRSVPDVEPVPEP